MFLDTSGLFHLMNTTEVRHADAVEFYRAAHIRLTHSYVLAELVALATARGVDRASLLRYVDELLCDSEVEFHWIGEAEVRAGIALLERRRDKSYSLCDAVSFLVMRDKHVTEALTSDHHFEQEGFKRLLV
jgi:predicted nucleic acid-binding protein